LLADVQVARDQLHAAIALAQATRAAIHEQRAARRSLVMVPRVRVYHGTSSQTADAILADGFRDGPPQWGAELGGVWFASYPLDQNEGVTGGGDDLVHVALDLDNAEQWEVEEPVARHILVVPAAVANDCPVALVGDGEYEQLGVEHTQWVMAGMRGPFAASAVIVANFPTLPRV